MTPNPNPNPNPMSKTTKTPKTPIRGSRGRGRGRGKITVIAGPMFAGKTTLLKRLVKEAQSGGSKAVIISRDTRWGPGIIKTHKEREGTPCVYAPDTAAIKECLRDIKDDLDLDLVVIAFDEVQFYDHHTFLPVVRDLAGTGAHVICAGLTQDYRGEPWETTAFLMAEADDIKHLKATCSQCLRGHVAIRSYRRGEALDRVKEGGSDEYQPLCRHCYNKTIAAAAVAATTSTPPKEEGGGDNQEYKADT